MAGSALTNLRVEYGKQLVLAGALNPDIIVLEGDLKESTQSIQFQDAFPDRFFEMGIAEQNMVGVAAGLARCGKIPIVHSFASFISMKACEQVRTNLAFQNLNVKLVVSHAGVSAGSAGSTHHAIEDIAIMRSMPNMTVMVPGDGLDLQYCFQQALKIIGPVYLRISASDAFDAIRSAKFPTYKPSYLINEGSDIVLITTGITLNMGKCLSELLSNLYGISVKHLHLSTIKPIDKDVITKCANTVKWIFSLEEHNVIGGLGSAVAEIASEIGLAKLHRFGILDHYCSLGTQQYIFEKEGFTVDSLSTDILRLLSS